MWKGCTENRHYWLRWAPQLPSGADKRCLLLLTPMVSQQCEFFLWFLNSLASMVPNAPMMTTFALSCWVGNSCVQGVSHALHSPLMAMTNAISGMTIVGGMLQLGGGLLPGTVPQVIANNELHFTLCMSSISDMCKQNRHWPQPQ